MHNGRHLSAALYRQQGGFAYILVLMALAMLGLASQGVITYASQIAQRDRESQLLFVGQAYRNALRSYYDASPGTRKTYPARLQDLLEDVRLVGIRRHIRELYPDPMTGNVDWGLIRNADGGINGVFSRSERMPLQTGVVELEGLTFQSARTYSDWRFAAVVPPASNSAQKLSVPGLSP